MISQFLKNDKLFQNNFQNVFIFRNLSYKKEGRNILCKKILPSDIVSFDCKNHASFFFYGQKKERAFALSFYAECLKIIRLAADRKIPVFHHPAEAKPLLHYRILFLPFPLLAFLQDLLVWLLLQTVLLP